MGLLKIFEEIKWNGYVVSPFDPHSPVYKCENGKYRCKNSGKYFTVLTNTVFHGSRIPLEKWLIVIELIQRDPNVTGAHVAQLINTSIPTASKLLSKLRKALKIYKSRKDVNSIEVNYSNFGLADWLKALK